MRFQPLLGVLLAAVIGLQSARAHGPGGEMGDAANNFLATLKPEQKAKAVFEFKDDERHNWHFVPRERRGLPVKEMTPTQRAMLQPLLLSGLSARGFVKANAIISLEETLAEMEGPDRRFPRDPEMYFVSVFGTPGETNTWGWRFEGHHLALNFTVVNGHDISGGPSFLGSNPAEIKSGPRKGFRALGPEEDLGRELVRALDEEQRKKAVFAEKAPPDIITGNRRKAALLEPIGIKYDELTQPQQAQLRTLVQEYAGRLRPEIAGQIINRIITAGTDKISFAWAGSVEPGQGHYYRVQGPTFLLEYDNTQNNNNHVHAVWRDLEDDFGEDLLKKHYEQGPAHGHSHGHE